MSPAASFPIKEVRKRDGRMVSFDRNRITNAVYRAMLATGEGNRERDPLRISDRVVRELLKKYPKGGTPSIEEVQDIVEEALILMDFPKTAKAYILYRNERAQIRGKVKTVPERVAEFVRESKKYFRNALSEFVYYRTYSRWIDEENRRETWIETVDRYMSFMKENLSDKLKDEEYSEIREAILKQEAMPSMRLLWSAGRAARKTNVSAYNCSFIAPSKLDDFAEIMYLLMCGTGVGFSVESQNIQMLPIVKKQGGEKLDTHVITDSKEGWGDSLTLGLKTWYGGKDIEFDYSQLRSAGARLATMGGQSSGPGPLKALLEFSRAKIFSKQGRRMSNIDIHDIICKIGEVVVMGGVRRSALISLSDLDDDEMRSAKTGQFYLTEPQRAMANNSAVYNEKPTATEFMDEWLALAKSGTGERGVFNRGGLARQLPPRRWKTFKDHYLTSGTNPCLTGDTLIYVADGRGHVPIAQLAKEGKDIPVFCYNNRGVVTVRYMRNPRLTGVMKPIYRVTLDDDSTIRATANHKLRLKTGEYKEIKDLKNGDSLSIITKFEASIKDVFHDANSRSQDYWWTNNGLGNNMAEHRIIASFHFNTNIPQGFVVHHKDRNAQNNAPDNLEIFSKEDHDALHGNLMTGDSNPMRRAHKEWSPEKWMSYRQKQARQSEGEKNKNFSGATDESLKAHALFLTKKLGYRFSHNEWMVYAKERGLPQYFSKWRRDHLGGIVGLAKWAAADLGFEHKDIDPRVLKSYKKYTAQGYNCEIINGKLVIKKRCEVCDEEFCTTTSIREYGVCSITCGLTKKWNDEKFRTETINRIREAHGVRKTQTQALQAKIYSDLKFRLGRDPLKIEWAQQCKENHVSPEISRQSSPFPSYNLLQEYAALHNHKVVSVEFCGYEDVYNGTVDEFHNFFIGGFISKTKNGKRKFVYLNNLQCGEIVLRNKQFCNLTEVVAREEDTLETLLAKIRIATVLGTYQSTLTNFSYISKEWKSNCEEERLLGVSVTGHWDSPEAQKPETLAKLREYALKINRQYAKRFEINESTCVTCVKPSGTVSQLVDAASGMHPRHSKYYIRRVRISATDPLFEMLKDQKFPYWPEVGQSEQSATTFVLEFPVKAPASAKTKNDFSAIDQLEYWKIVKENYTEHNPSVTVLVGPDEWIESANWLYKNWEILGGLSFLPRQDHVYQLAPFEEITEERYNDLISKMPAIDFSHIMIYEKEDQTQGAKELACVGGVCEVDLTEEMSQKHPVIAEPAAVDSA